eukprot:9500597-Alexandrium_andersonii.AAC.1
MGALRDGPYPERLGGHVRAALLQNQQAGHLRPQERRRLRHLPGNQGRHGHPLASHSRRDGPEEAAAWQGHAHVDVAGGEVPPAQPGHGQPQADQRVHLPGGLCHSLAEPGPDQAGVEPSWRMGAQPSGQPLRPLPR